MLYSLQKIIYQALWSSSSKKYNKLQYIIIFIARIFYAVIRDSGKGLTSLRATSLVYTTLLSLVPLLAISFSVLKGFGTHNVLEPTLLTLFEPLGEKGIALSRQLLTFVDNTKVTALGSIGLVVLIFTVLSLVKKIESAFNFTWKITQTRGFFNRFSNYLSVILLGPVLLLAAATIKTSLYSSTVINKISAIEPFGSLLIIVSLITPYIFNIISFTFIYKLIPNTQVKISAALFGAFFTTLLWKISSLVFTAFIVNSTNYAAIYSSFAILIIFMLWLYFSWLIVLTGSSLSYYYQHPQLIKKDNKNFRLSCQARENLTLSIAQLIATNFHLNKPLYTLNTLAEKLSVAPQIIKRLLTYLLDANLIKQTISKQYIPAQSLENITLDMIYRAARDANDSASLNSSTLQSTTKVDAIIQQVETAILNETKNISLQDLVELPTKNTDN